MGDMFLFAFLRSSKYQLPLNEESAATGNLSKDCKDGPMQGDQPAAAEPEKNLARDIDASATEPLAAVGKNLPEDCAEQPRQDREDSHAVTGTVTTDDNAEEQQLSNCLSTDCDEQKESETPPACGDALMQRGETAPDVQGETFKRAGVDLSSQQVPGEQEKVPSQASIMPGIGRQLYPWERTQKGLNSRKHRDKAMPPSSQLAQEPWVPTPFPQFKTSQAS